MAMSMAMAKSLLISTFTSRSVVMHTPMPMSKFKTVSMDAP